jgi:hypothetical protein
MTKLRVGPVGFFFVILVALAVLVLAPLMTISSLNVLFGLGIEFTVWTWASMFWLQAVTFGGVISAVGRLGRDK